MNQKAIQSNPANSLEALKLHSVVVADTGDFTSIARFSPREATTNPSLILAAARAPEYRYLLRETSSELRGAPLDYVSDAVLVRFGREILARVPGRVSTEVDARLSFDTRASVVRARRIISMYEAAGLSRTRVLIKLAATWEGVVAAATLEREGIACNLTLVFAMCQALACANAGITLISPFVGRIYDWHKARAGSAWVEAEHAGVLDPGVQSVAAIHACFKRYGLRTEVMAASFRNIEQVRALAGCDLLTISPSLLEALQTDTRPLAISLDRGVPLTPLPAPVVSEADFRFALLQDEMAHDKLAAGIRSFVLDAIELDTLLCSPDLA